VNLTDALATYRLTRLATADTLLDGPRDAVVRWAYHRAGLYPDVDDADPGGWAAMAMDDPAAPKLATLATCRWCAGMWVALGVVAARRLCPRLWPPLARALAYSAGAALFARLED
jgi:hypothetical protein